MKTNTIIGAGIGGLTTAIAFEQKGINYQIFERFTRAKVVGAGIWLSPNALQVFDQLGLLSEIKDRGNSIDKITIGKPDLSAISYNPQDFVKKKFGYSAVAIHRAILQKVLLSNISSQRLHLGRSFESYKSLSNGQLQILFKNGFESITDTLIGADGIHSQVRAQLFPSGQVRYTGQTCWRGIADTVIDRHFDHHVYELWGDQVRFGISRIAPGKYYWFAVSIAESNQTDDSEHLHQKLHGLFSNFHTVVHELIKSTPADQISRKDIYDLKPMSNWHKDNVCLIGDAAHATTPNMGQGGAQAIEDAHYLSNYIIRMQSTAAFRQFQKRRQSKVNSIVKESWMIGKMAHWKNGTWLRNFILENLPKAMLERKMVKMYEIDSF